MYISIKNGLEFCGYLFANTRKNSPHLNNRFTILNVPLCNFIMAELGALH